MGILGWIVLGLVAGLIARALLPGSDRGGLILTTVLGIAGGLLGGFVASVAGFGDPIDEFFDFSTWVAAVVGSVLILLVWRAIDKRGCSHPTAPVMRSVARACATSNR
jgi:uncharacterized membrane protein YeaQ/YmgE (transglycosylase-associated protein family)